MDKRIRDYDIEIGKYPTGKNNSITDVKGVKVGHKTLDYDGVKTGVTVVVPKENMFQEKLLAASYIINGFGKSIGLAQIDELGTLETPIVLTNTLSVAAASHGLVSYMLERNIDIGDTTGTVNPVVCECNDSKINDSRALSVKSQDVYSALAAADIDFDQGNVGAGTGMTTYQLRGGIGSASRIVKLDGKDYTIGILTLSNFGKLDNFILDGQKIGRDISKKIKADQDFQDKGSIIFILATDVPLSSRQLKRLVKRVQPGLGRTGSFTGNGSGELALGFTTANRVDHYEKEDIVQMKKIKESKLDDLFEAVVEASEEAVLNAMIASKSGVDRRGRKVYALSEFLEEK